jgi:predicted TIM-barrel fold metal-dependent hydrolase
MALSEEDENTIKNAQVLMDTSGRYITHFANYVKRFGKNRFAFGTHFPVLDYYTGLLRIESLRKEEATEEDRELFRHLNARQFLKL